MNHLLSILALPFTVTIIIPSIILYPFTSLNIGWGLNVPSSWLPSVVGAVVIASGLALMAMTISLFVTVGKGTLAPWDPPKHLVVRGVYRHVRNPMISGVMSILLGEAIVFGSMSVFTWFAVFVLVNMIYMPLIEERDLEQRFGDEYLLYKQNVPRWIPRVKAWDERNVARQRDG